METSGIELRQHIPAVHARVEGVYTNTCLVHAYRGAGRPEAAYLIGRLAHLAAREIRVDPAEIRRRNFIRAFPLPDAARLPL